MNQYKSEGEWLIAEVLTRWNIDFRYEHPILIKETKQNDTEKLRIWYPDFWLPKYNIIIEYWGMEGDRAYDEGKRCKQAAYKSLDIDCIPVYRSTVQKDLKSYLLIKIKTILNERVRHFENRNKV
jgi:hypothetical protein